MAAEPAGLEGDGAAGGWPVCSVSGCSYATAWFMVSFAFFVSSLLMLLTWIHPLHAVGKRLVGDEVVAAPSWVYYDAMGLDEGRQGECEE